MVILDNYQLVFIEIPRTGSEAIRQELILRYGGRSVGTKHSMKIPPELSGYRLVYGTSNPVDRTYSKFLKYKNRPSSYFMHAGSWGLVKYLAWFYNMIPFVLIRVCGLRFNGYLRIFMPLPFVDPSRLITTTPFMVLRKENLNDDFRELLTRLDVPQIQELPRVNKTEKKNKMEFSLDASLIQWRFNIELQKQNYPYQDFASSFSKRVAEIGYKISHQIKRVIWKVARG